MSTENELVSEILYDALRDAEYELSQIEDAYALFKEKTANREQEFQVSLNPLRERVATLSAIFDGEDK